MKIAAEHTKLKGLTSIKKITKRLKDFGLDPLQCPKFDLPTIPDDLHDKPGRVVWQLLNRMTRWSEYLTTQLAMHKVRETNLRAVYEDLRDHVYVNLKTPASRKMTVDERKRLADLHPDVRECKEELLKSTSDVGLLEARAKALSRNIQTVSRGVTILEAELHAHTREHSVGTRTNADVDNRIRNR